MKERHLENDTVYYISSQRCLHESDEEMNGANKTYVLRSDIRRNQEHRYNRCM